jgi:hypothetical protein
MCSGCGKCGKLETGSQSVVTPLAVDLVQAASTESRLQTNISPAPAVVPDLVTVQVPSVRL